MFDMACLVEMKLEKNSLILVWIVIKDLQERRMWGRSLQVPGSSQSGSRQRPAVLDDQWRHNSLQC